MTKPAETPRPETPRQWCDALQGRLMAAIDAAWALADSSDDPAVRAKAAEKVKLCGQIAATARKVTALSPATPDKDPRRQAALQDLSILTKALETANAARAESPPPTQADLAKAALARVRRKGGRGRL